MPRTLNKESDRDRDRGGAPRAATPDAPPRAYTLPRGVVGIHVRRRPTPEALPLWREVIELEEQLRPAAVATLAAERRPAHPVKAAIALVATVIGVVLWAVELQRLELLAVTESRRFFSAPVPPLLSYITPERISLAWGPITGALSAGVVLFVLLLLLPKTRLFTRRHPVFPVVLGSALVLGTMHVIYYMNHVAN